MLAYTVTETERKSINRIAEVHPCKSVAQDVSTAWLRYTANRYSDMKAIDIMNLLAALQLYVYLSIVFIMISEMVI